MPFVEMFSYPFMQRAFIAGAVLGILLAALGIFVTLRKMTFFGDGVAHSSLAGIAIAILLGIPPLPAAIAWGVLIALLIYGLEHKTNLPTDTLIGIFFTSSMALGVILMSFTSGYQPELISFLFGSILSITTFDLTLIITTAAIIMLWYILSFRQLTFMSLSEEIAIIAGVPVALQNAFFYVALAVATVLGVKILGIILVSALLVLPSATSRLVTSSFKQHIFASLVLSEIIVFSGLSLSYFYDLPSGATIILFGTGLFFLATLLKAVRR